MGKGDDGILGIGVIQGRHGHRRNLPPARRREEHGPGHGHRPTVGRGNGGRHHDRPGRRAPQQDKVGAHTVLRHRQGRRGDGHPRCRRDHRHGKGQRGRIASRPVGVGIRDRVGQRDRRDRSNGNPAQRTRPGVKDQANRDVAGQGVAQDTIAGGGCRQRQGRNDRSGKIRLVSDPDRPEGRCGAGVGDRDDHGAGGNAAIAAHRMGDGGRIDGAIRIVEGRDGDGLHRVPGRGSEGQRAGDVEVTAGIGDRGDGHVVGRQGGQHDGVAGQGTLFHGQGGRGNGHPAHVVVGHRDRDRTGCDTAVAGDPVGDGGGGVSGVRIVEGGDGDGLHRVPARGGEDQRAGDGDGVAGSGDRGDGHVVGRHGRQHDRVGGNRVLDHGQGGRGNGHPAHVVVGHRDRDRAGRDTAVAGDPVGDGGGGVSGVRIVEGGDGDGLHRVPARGGEDQRAGDGDGVAGSGDRGDGHVVGRHGRQHDRVGGDRVLDHGQGGRGKGDAGGHGHRHGEGQAGFVAGRRVGVRIRDGVGQRDGRGHVGGYAGQGAAGSRVGQAGGDGAS